MSKRNLTKREALELITPVVDDEVDETVRNAFFEYIEEDEDVRNRYESIKRLKEVVANRCPCARAPSHLRERITDFLVAVGRSEASDADPEEPIYDVPCNHSVDAGPDAQDFSPNTHIWRYTTAAALVLIALLAGIFFLGNNSTKTYNIEEYVYTHFTKHNGQMVTPTISTASLSDAELKLAEIYNMAITVPTLKNATLKGIVYSNFVDGFKAPMLEYHLPSEDQYIYIFAFKISDLNQYQQLRRSQEAVQSCVSEDDFHIRNVNDKYIVSWKWSDTWYAAVSNHDGKTLASLVEPLNFTD